MIINKTTVTSFVSSMSTVVIIVNFSNRNTIITISIIIIDNGKEDTIGLLMLFQVICILKKKRKNRL